MKKSLEKQVYDIAVETFEVSSFLYPIKEDEVTDKQQFLPPENKVRTEVGFRGASEGQIVLTPSQKVLTAMAGNMLGIDKPSEKQKKDALCEVGNIICGNVVSLLSDDDNICYIEPSRLLYDEEETSGEITDKIIETVSIYLDEGKVEIDLYSNER